MKFKTLLSPLLLMGLLGITIFLSVNYWQYDKYQSFIKKSFENSTEAHFYRLKEEIRAQFEYRQLRYKLEEQAIIKYHESIQFVQNREANTIEDFLRSKIKSGLVDVKVMSIENFDTRFIENLKKINVIIDAPILDLETNQFYSSSYSLLSNKQLLVIERYLDPNEKWETKLLELVKTSELIDLLEIWISSEDETQIRRFEKTKVSNERLNADWFIAFKELFMDGDPIVIEKANGLDGVQSSYQFLVQGTLYSDEKQLFGAKIVLSTTILKREQKVLKLYFIAGIVLISLLLGTLFFIIYYFGLRDLIKIDQNVKRFSAIEDEKLLSREDEIGRLAKSYTLSQKEQKEQRSAIETNLIEKETLLKEIHHRVKNNLAVVMSLVRLQGRTLKDRQQKEQFLALQNRIKSMELVHRSLYQSDTLAAISIYDYLKELIDELILSYGEEEKKIELIYNIQVSTLDIDRAISLGLVINELITNALKYAFREQDSGEIVIQIEKKEELYHVTLFDNGSGATKEASSEGTSFGGKLIKTLVSAQLKGKMNTLPLSRGYGVEIIF
jgi:two-component sensor histidine kinase